MSKMEYEAEVMYSDGSRDVVKIDMVNCFDVGTKIEIKKIVK